jgi:acetolactate synthase-1/2/3 large subunit
LRLDTDAEIDRVIAEACAVAQQKRPVLVDVAIDYSKRTQFTTGIMQTNLDRFDFGTKTRLIGRALWRRVRG